MKKMLRPTKTWIVVMLLGAAAIPTAQTGGRFLLLDSGAREVGMAGIPTGSVNSIFYNPALLAFKNNLEFGLTHAEWLQTIRYETFGVTKPLPHFGAFGLGALLLYMNDLEYADDSIPTGQLFSAYDFSLLGSISRRFADKLGVGLTLKGIYRRVHDRDCAGGAADVGASFLALKWLNVNFAVQNIGPAIGYETRNTSLPLTIRGGVGAALLDNSLRFGLDLVSVRSEALEIRFGAEYEIARVLGIRGGYRSGSQDAGVIAGLATGLGVKFREFGVDYSIAPYGDLGNTHRVSLTYTQGALQDKEEALVKLMMEELKKKEKMMGESFYRRGLDYLARKEFDESIDAFDKALTWDPELADAQVKMDEARRLKTAQAVTDHANRGIVHYNTGDMVNAYYEFSQALTLAPTNQELINWRNRISAALVPKVPQAVAQRFQSGVNYYSRGDYRKAIDEWKAVLATNPNHQESQEYILRAQVKLSEAVTKHLLAAQTSFDRKEWDQALTSANRVLNLEPASTMAADLKKRILDNLRRELSQTLEKAVDFYNRKDFAAAEESFRQVLSWDPKNRTALDYVQRLKPKGRYDKKYLADLYLKGINSYTDNDFKSALLFWNKIAEIDPKYENIARNIDRARKRLAEYKQP